MPAACRQELAMIRRNVQLEARLIDDLLDLTRITRGTLDLRTEALDVHAILRHTIDDCCASLIAGRQLNIGIHLDAARHHVHADPIRLGQVFWNLLTNAVKFTLEGGSITVRTQNTSAGALLIEIADTGIGIEPETLPRLFRALEQADPAITRQFGGLGLGLAITKAIVDLHGGVITVQSEGKGRGTTFTIELPVQPAPAAKPPSAPARVRMRTPGDERALHILLVEDHPDTARVMGRLLKADGHRVTTAHDVRSALATAEQERFDLLISDVGLPDRSGHDLMRELRQRYGIKGIAMSGFGMQEDIANSQAAGFAEHLTKPVELTRLEAAIDRVAGRADG